MSKQAQTMGNERWRVGGSSIRPKAQGRFTLAGEEKLEDPPLLQAWSIHIQTDTHLNSLALFQHVGRF